MNKGISTRAKRFYTVGIILLAVVVIAFLLSLFWTPYDPYATDAASKLQRHILSEPIISEETSYRE